MGGSFEEFSALNNFESTGFVLGCENCDFKALLRLVKSFINLDTRKNILYGNQDGNGEASGCSCSCPLTGDLSSSACVCGCFACVCGRVVDGVSATVATCVYYYYKKLAIIIFIHSSVYKGKQRNHYNKLHTKSVLYMQESSRFMHLERGLTIITHK